MSALPLHQIALSKIQGIGPITAKKIVAYTGSIEQIFKEPANKLQKIPGVGEYLAQQIVQSDALRLAEKELEFIEKYKIQVLFYNDANYPTKLKSCEDAPLVLYKKGKCDLLNSKVISIVGTRMATHYGISACERIVSEFAELGFRPIIMSGLAYGIDICAHKAALKNNLPTVAALAHGFKTLYPAKHRGTAEKMLAEGALLTEFTSDVSIYRNNFLSRNRIVAGMADATLLIESAGKGGALVTMGIAQNYNRDTFALPGRVNDTYSDGCNNLLKQGKTQFLQSAEDVVKALNWNAQPQANVQRQLFESFNAEEKHIMNVLTTEPQSIDEVCKNTKLTMNKVSSLLLQLEFSGWVKSFPGKMFVRV